MSDGEPFAAAPLTFHLISGALNFVTAR